jgi:hypothetical protein
MTHEPIACTLTVDAYADRLELIRRAGRQALERVERHNDHIELRFRHEDQIARDLVAIRDAEAECCAFLRLTLDERPDAIVLSIASADPAGAVVVDELAAAFVAGRAGAAPGGHSTDDG